MNIINYVIEVLFAVGLFTNSLLFVPQIVRLIQKKHADDLSLITFGGFNAINFMTVLHGMMRDDVILMLGAMLALIANTCVTVLIIWYRYWKAPISS